MGGEKSRVAPRSDPGTGSPPRGRGKVSSVSMCTRSPGITPAWAGKRSCCASRSRSLKDHPRVGGEKLTSLPKIQPALGSPPRGRGKALHIAGHWVQGRITPAWAGKRVNMISFFLTGWDHPRVGGEKLFVLRRVLVLLGSPPRGRGKDIVVKGRSSREGITPAWAGKRLKRSHRSGIFISGPIPFHSVLHRPAGSGGSRAGRDGSPAGQPQNTGPA